MPGSAEFVSVAVPTPVRTAFCYRLGPAMTARVGSRVLVPFGRRKLPGVVIRLDTEPDVDIGKVRTVLDVFHPDGDVCGAITRLCLWAADYYQHPVGEVFAAALPGAVRKGWNPREPVAVFDLTAEGRSIDPATLTRAPAQKQALLLLRQGALTRESLTGQGVSAATLRTLAGKNWGQWLARAKARGAPFRLGNVNRGHITITGEQRAVIRQIEEHGRGTCLLQGVTGSGKTEIYLRVIEPLLRAGRQVIVLVPEIGLTPQTIARFRERFDVPIAVLHSSLSDGERAQSWVQARDGSAGIILGTRSAIFTPLCRPGAIIVDEEHDASYKQQDGFRYSARDLAVLRGQFEQVPVLLGSATPSLESLHNVETGKYLHLQLKARPPGVRPEVYELMDTRHLEVRDGFTLALRNRIAEQLANGSQVLVFLNRRGFAPVMICNECTSIAHCRHCDAKLTFHLNLKALICHHCGAVTRDLLHCRTCGGNSVSAIGMGTQRVEQTLAATFPDYPVLRIDRDSTRTRGALESLVTEINKGEPALLVGTQLLAKGHHFPKVTLVALLDIDAGFYSSDFRAMERLGQLVLQVGGRSGRADKPGAVLIQTAFATHPLLQTLIGEGYGEFAGKLLEDRKASELPPWSFQALIKAEAGEPSLSREFLERIVQREPPSESVHLLGPIPALMEKKAGRFRQLLIVSSTRRAAVHRELARRISIAESLSPARQVRWSVDVDPVDLY